MTCSTPVEAGEKDEGRLANGIGDDRSLGQFEMQRGLDQLRAGTSNNLTANGGSSSVGNPR